MQKIKKFIPIGLALTPFIAMAKSINDLIMDFMNIIDTLIPLLIAIGVLLFLIGVVKYISAAGDEEKRKDGRNMMIYGIIGLFVMIAFWGLVNVLLSTFNLQTNIPVTPQFTP